MLRSNHISARKTPPERMQFYCLAAASSIVFLFMILGGYKLIAYYYSDTFLMVPALIFLGITLTRELSDAGKRNLKLGVFMVLWYVFVTSVHRLQNMDTLSCSMFLCMYLLAFPYAAVMDDGEKQKGLTMAVKMFAAASLITAGYGLLVLAGHVPAFLESSIKYGGGRLEVLTHPNMTACVYMIGATFCVGGSYRVRKLWQKVLLLGAAALQVVLIALTNSRTTMLTVSVLLGGLSFFGILRGGICFAVKTRGGWLRILVATVAAVAVIAGIFVGSTKLYEANYSHLVKIYVAEQEAAAQAVSEAAAAEAAKAAEAPVPEETAAAQAVTEAAAAEAAKAAEAPVPEETAAAQAITEAAAAEAAEAVETPVPEETAVVLEEAEVPAAETPNVRLPGGYGQGSLENDMKTLNGRTVIWKASFAAIKNDPQILLWGTGYADTAITENSDWQYIKHSHNSWIEVLLKMGIPGLAVALVITWIGIKKSLLMLFKSRDMWKICIALLVPCLMVAGALEPYFFNGYPDYHMIEYIFFLLVGYLSQWKGDEAAVAE